MSKAVVEAVGQHRGFSPCVSQVEARRREEPPTVQGRSEGASRMGEDEAAVILACTVH